MEDLGVYLAERTDVRGQDDCWPWLRSTGSHGYGQGWDSLTVRTAHSMTWEFWTGERVELPMTIDHLCHNRICQNPLHLRVIPNRANARDNGFATRTHCPRGHEYTEDNIRYTKPKRPGRKPGRACIVCEGERNAARYR